MLICNIKYLFSKILMELKVPLYLNNPKLYQINTKIIHKEGDLFEFEDTIFHLQGGGQPNDKGWIISG
jgi:Ser-tRNA(Ala) deacylase AlaX